MPAQGSAQEGGESVGRRQLGRFQILELLGRGSMGVVYRAEDPTLRREVAIKILLPETQETPELRQARAQRFVREARSLAKLRHPNVVPVFEAGQVGSEPYMVMDYVRGGETLHELTSGHSRLGTRQVLQIARDVARGLGAAHAAGLVHRDVKPSNVLVKDGRGLLADFGLVFDQASHSARLSRPGGLVGTPVFLSPEQVDTTFGELSPATDVFSLGSLLYWCLSGRAPFASSSLQELLVDIVTGSSAPLGSLEEVDEAVVELIQRCHKKNPDERYANGDEVADALEEILRAPAPAAPRPPGRNVAGYLASAGLSCALTAALLSSGQPLPSAAQMTPRPAAPSPPPSAAPPQQPALALAPPRRSRGSLEAALLHAAQFMSRVYALKHDLRAAACASEALELRDDPGTRKLVAIGLNLPCSLDLTLPPLHQVLAVSEDEGVLISSAQGVMRLRPTREAPLWSREEFLSSRSALPISALAARASRFLLGTRDGRVATLAGLPAAGARLRPSPLLQLPAPSSPVAEVAWVGAERAAVRDEAGRVFLLALASDSSPDSQPAGSPRLLVASGASAIAATPRALLVGDRAGGLSLFSSSGALRKTWPAHDARVSALLALDSGWASASFDGRLCVWSEAGTREAEERLPSPLVSLQRSPTLAGRVRIGGTRHFQGKPIGQIYAHEAGEGLKACSPPWPNTAIAGFSAGSWLVKSDGLLRTRGEADAPKLVGILPGWTTYRLSEDGRVLLLGTTDGRLYGALVHEAGGGAAPPALLASGPEVHPVSAIGQRGQRLAFATRQQVHEISLGSRKALRNYRLREPAEWLEYRGQDICVGTKRGITLFAPPADGGERTFLAARGLKQGALNGRQFLLLDRRGRLLRYADETATKPSVLAEGVVGFALAGNKLLVARKDRIVDLAKVHTPSEPNSGPGRHYYQTPGGTSLRGAGACNLSSPQAGSLLAWGEDTPLGPQVSLLRYVNVRGEPSRFRRVASLPLATHPTWESQRLACHFGGRKVWWKVDFSPALKVEGTPAQVQALVVGRLGWVALNNQAVWVGSTPLESERVCRLLERTGVR